LVESVLRGEAANRLHSIDGVMDLELIGTVPVSAVVATRDRSEILRRTLQSLAGQNTHPSEVIIVDASATGETKILCSSKIQKSSVRLKWLYADQTGAAAQRNQGVSVARHEVVWFFDDDVIFEPHCVERLWQALQSDSRIGGVNAMITNQTYGTPRAVSRFMFKWMSGHKEPSYAGRMIGPAINLLPEDRDDIPEIVPVDWLNLGCTMYRREALPDPPFPAKFTGYSLMEDVALSLEVGKKWKLANARTARIFHDSQPADYKSSQRAISCMQLTNRYFVMTQILNKRGFSDHLRLLVWELFQLMSMLARSETRGKVIGMLRGQLEAVARILKNRR